MVDSGCQCKRHGFDPWVRKIPWKRKQQPTPVLLSGELHGQRSLALCNPWGCKDLDTIQQLSTRKQFWIQQISLQAWELWSSMKGHRRCLLLVCKIFSQSPNYLLSHRFNAGPPRWLRRPSVCLQCRRPGFNPWAGKIPWKRKCSILGWRILWTEEPGGLQSMGHKDSDTTE